MASLSLSFALFLYFALVGRAVLVSTSTDRGVLRPWLLAPGMGLATVLLGVTTLNQLGLPVRSFAWVLALALGLASLLIILRRAPSLPWKPLGALLSILCASLLWSGLPALEFGFGWLSFANDDMANYCLAAERTADVGFFTLPSEREINRTDFAAVFWLMHVGDLMRFGSELLLSWVISLTGLRGTQVFMPVILSLGLIQITATSGLVLHRGRDRKWALLSALLLAASPLFGLGMLYQLIAQVGGLALAMTALALLTQGPRRGGRTAQLRPAIAPGLLAFALCVYYPEISPFAWLSFGLYLLAALWKDKERRLGWAYYTAAATLLCLLLLQLNLFSYLHTFVKQVSGNINSSDPTRALFPFYLIPTGVANFFGWMPLNKDYADPIPLISIVPGLAMLPALLLWGVLLGLRKHPAALLGVVMMAVTAKLYLGNNGFGLYKMAMFLQPILAAAVVWWALRLCRKGLVLAATLALWIAALLPSYWYYIDYSRGIKPGGLGEIAYVSRLGLKGEQATPPEARVGVALENLVTTKLATTLYRGTPLEMPVKDFAYVMYEGTKQAGPMRDAHPLQAIITQSRRYDQVHLEDFTRKDELWSARFDVPAETGSPDYVLTGDAQLSLFNKFGYDLAETPEQLLRLLPHAQTRNFLTFVHSSRGQHYYLGEPERITIFQQERDYLVPGQLLSGIGRFMLLQIENPDPEIYLRYAVTNTLLLPRRSWKGKAALHGETVLPIPLTGEGSANLYVGPIKPLLHNGRYYLAVDLHEKQEPIREPRHGIRQLYGEKVPRDYRWICGWGRDISAITPEQYRKLVRPAKVDRFPQDLANLEGLEYSGAYEDGWLSSRSQWRLAALPQGGVLRLTLVVPDFGDKPSTLGELFLRTGDGNVFQMRLSPGTHNLELPVKANLDLTELSLEFSHPQRLPGDDARSTGGRLLSLSVAEAPLSAEWNFDDPSGLRLPLSGVDGDGWMQGEGTLFVPEGSSGMRLVVDFLGANPEEIGELQLIPEKGEIQHFRLQSGRNIVNYEAKPEHKPTVRYRFKNASRISAQDPRICGGRLVKLTCLP